MRKSGLYRLRRAAVLGGLTAAYYAAGRYGLSLAFLNSSASPVWPPTGLALAAMLLLGRWVWPSILAGAFLVSLTTSDDWQAASMIACGNAIEALAGYWMAERFCGGRRTFDAIPDIFRFALTAGTGASAIAASLGTAALLLRHLAVPAEAGRVWFTWWMGDTISAWMLTPFLVLLGRVRMVRVERMRALEGAALIAGLFIVGQLVFGGWLPRDQRNLPLEYLGIPFLIWACYRFDKRGASAAVILLGAIAVNGTLLGNGPFAGRDMNTSLLLLQAFLGTVSLMSLVLATALGLKRAALRRMATLVEESRAANEKLRHAEENVRQAQKMEAVGRLAGGVAHDFNNLLTAINGYSEVVLARLPEGDPNRSFVEEIRKAGDRAALVTQQLLAFSRKQMVMPAVLDVNAVIGDLERMLSRLIGENISFRVSPGDIGKVKADPGQVAQVVMNLVLNGRDAMPSGGDLTIATRNVDIEPEADGFHLRPEPGRYVCIEVRDSGVGMDESVKGHLFEPFFSTKQGGTGPGGAGTGLGLSTVYGIMQQNKGGLKVVSDPGKGAAFYAYFRRTGEDWSAGPLPDPVEAPVARAPKETVLVVEDEENVRTLVRHVLEAQGYRVLEASGAREAMYMHENHEGGIDLLLTDIVLSGKSGREIAKEFAELRPGIRIIFMSGYTDDTVIRSELEKTRALFMGKPFTPSQLLQKVRAALEGAEARAGQTGSGTAVPKPS
jgi:signal transduction histidine kinase/CheY-like chemotaxis protein